ncbi:restriction endonuclease subunit S [Acinetobacter sp. HY1485]|uniref:restriction endonuclease subunit S n=1 Tax=Acinetobacter sp. HY1485 TaxID=2970918 RepID=UPI0022B9A33C|nr:restriction endonuclease subunit S [Acinetobacter sp. HY1485]
MPKYQAYAEYKDSGVEWLGDIPSHWELKSTKNIFKIINGATPKSGVENFWDGKIIWITPSDLSKLTSDKISNSSRYITKHGFNSCGTSLVPENTIILSCRAPIGLLAIATEEVCTNQGCKSLVSHQKVDNKFIYYYLTISKVILNVLGRGTTFLELSSDELGNYKLPYPNKLAEQTQIANFLDYETAKIDTLIAKQKKLIELLKEKRQAVISHAVTKGLDPNVKMKPSGVEWLGDVPEHWKILKLKNIANNILCKSNSLDKIYVGLENISSRSGKFLETEGIEPEGLSNSFKIGDVLFGKLRPYLAKSWRADFSGICSAEFLILRSRVLYPKFLQYFTLTENFIRQVDSSTYGSKMPRANWDFISLLAVPVPTYRLSKDIANYLDNQTKKIDSLISKAETAIKLIQERRTALISSAVTGKIDVRDWQKPQEA